MRAVVAGDRQLQLHRDTRRLKVIASGAFRIDKSVPC